jgi:CheY-like chemotaxis protein
MAKQNLLLVDDDPRSLRVMEVSLRNAGYAVTTAANGAEALTKVSTARPALVVSDTDMPVLDGFELCRRLKANAQTAEIPFLFLTEESAVESKVRGLELGADDYLSKPIYIKEVITRVRMVLSKRERESLERKDKRRFFGSLEDMGVVDLLQTVEMGRKSGIITIEQDPEPGKMWFEGGRIIDAESGRLGGEEAVYRMLTWENGNFEIDFRPPDRRTQIGKSTQGLLMEGMRRMDEWGRMCEQLPPLSTVFQVDYSELSERLAELPDEVNELLRLLDGHRSALQAIDDADLPDLDALGAISRLYFEGIIYAVEQAPVELPPPSSSAPMSAPPVSAPPAHATEPPRERSRPPSLLPEPTPEPDLSFRPAGPERDLVDDLLASAADLPALDDPLDAMDLGAAFAPPNLDMPPDDFPESDLLFAPPQPSGDDDDGGGALSLEDLGLGLGDPEQDSVGALPSLDGGTVSDHGHEQAFFDGPEADPNADDLFDEGGNSIPRSAYIAMGLVACAVAAAATFFAVRDTVTPRAAPPGALNDAWYEPDLKGREQIAKHVAIDAGWQTGYVPDGGVAVEPPETPVAPEGGAAASPDAPVVEAPKPVGEDPPPARKDDFDKLVRDGVALHGKGRYGDAVTRFEKALALAPSDQRALLAMSTSLLELDRGKEALRAAEKVARVNPRSAQAHLIIGSVKQNDGEKEAAIDAYEKYLELAPQARYAKDVRRVLEGMRR